MEVGSNVLSRLQAASLTILECQLAVSKAEWIAQVLRDMGFPEYIGKDPEMVEMRADNQGAIALGKNPHLHERSKHIDISYHHIRDLEREKEDQDPRMS